MRHGGEIGGDRIVGTEAHREEDIARLQVWLDTHHLKRVQIKKQAEKAVKNVGSQDAANWTKRAISWAEGTGARTSSVRWGLLRIKLKR